MLYQITYTIPGRGTVSSRGHTEEGKQQLMTAVLRAGGHWRRHPSRDRARAPYCARSRLPEALLTKAAMKDDDHLSIQGPPGGPAFPVSITGCGDNGWHGMSLRDYFAAQVMERMISLSVDADGGWHPDTVASGCYVLAGRHAACSLCANGRRGNRADQTEHD
jgi:hypothetical protein